MLVNINKYVIFVDKFIYIYNKLLKYIYESSTHNQRFQIHETFTINKERPY